MQESTRLVRKSLGRLARTSVFALAAPAAILALAACGEPNVENPVEVEQAVTLPKGDIVFVIDESGSMGPDIADVRARVGDIAATLGTTIDYNPALVGYGTGVLSTHNPPVALAGAPHIHTALTDDLTAFSDALDDMVANGGFEPGFAATSLAVSNSMGFREGAGTCVIMITDEDADDPGGQATALADLASRDAAFFGIVQPGFGSTNSQYGPDPGSLAEQTGGAVFDILSFRADADPVLNAVLDGCLKAIAGTVSVDINPTSCPNPIRCDGRGVIPVAIEGTESLDVTTIDPSSITLEGVAPLRWAIEDVSTPFEPFTGKADCFEDCNTAGPDGHDDLTLKFDQQEVLAALENDGISIANELCFAMRLEGALTEAAGATPISGEDVVRFLCDKE